MRLRFLVPALLACLVIALIFAGSDPNRMNNLAEVSRNSGFDSAIKELVIWLLALGLGGFILYLTLTRP